MTKEYIVFIDYEGQEIKAHTTVIYRPLKFLSDDYEPDFVRVDSIHDANTNSSLRGSDSLKRAIEAEALRVASLGVPI